MARMTHSGLWTREEAYDYLNARYHLDELDKKTADNMVSTLCSMTHRPWCRTHLQIVPTMAEEFGTDCTCDGPEKLGMVEPTTK
jgi:hypothetical protein